MKKNLFVLSFLKSLGISLLITFIAIAAIALAVKSVDSSVKILNAIMLICKIVSISAGSCILIKEKKRKGILLGAMVGLSYWICCFALSLLTGANGFSSIVFDALFSLLIGSISGIIWANLFSK